jgi:flavin reductase (DIM6/NTAB) family NADH-FMN oxidoreductase RutF
MDVSVRKRALGLLSNGMYVMTSSHGTQHGAATLTWISQASVKPLLVMAAIRLTSNVFKCLEQSRVVAIHILDADQQDLAQRFFAPTRVLGDTINGEPFEPGVTCAPILKNARAHFECVVNHIFSRGDHAVVVMEVVEAQCRGEIQPLMVAQSPWEVAQSPWEYGGCIHRARIIPLPCNNSHRPCGCHASPRGFICTT